MKHVLVHINVVKPLEPFVADAPYVRDFLGRLPEIFDAAGGFDGMKWHQHGFRLESGAFVPIFEVNQPGVDWGRPHIITMAGWRSFEALHSFAHRSRLHVEGMKSLRPIVDRSEGPAMAMWWVARGERLSLADGWDRLARLRRDGATREAFSLQQRFDPPELAA